jgi:hypothetical protein
MRRPPPKGVGVGPGVGVRLGVGGGGLLSPVQNGVGIQVGGETFEGAALIRISSGRIKFKPGEIAPGYGIYNIVKEVEQEEFVTGVGEAEGPIGPGDIVEEVRDRGAGVDDFVVGDEGVLDEREEYERRGAKGKRRGGWRRQ